MAALRPGSHTARPKGIVSQNYWGKSGEDVYEVSYRVGSVNSNASTMRPPGRSRRNAPSSATRGLFSATFAVRDLKAQNARSFRGERGKTQKHDEVFVSWLCPVRLKFEI